jgi:hypothetical protein
MITTDTTEGYDCTGRLGPILSKFGLLMVIESLATLESFRAASLCDKGELDAAAETLSCKVSLDKLAASIPGSRAQVARVRRKLAELTRQKPKGESIP